MSGIIQPSDALEIVTIDLQQGRPSDFMRELTRALGPKGTEDGVLPIGDWLLGLQLASKSDYLENKDLDHNLGKTSFTMPATVYLALCTSTPTDASTGTTIVEANYTGYARKKVEAAALNAAASGQSTNKEALTFAECTAGSSTVTAWALVDALTLGNVLYWGTATSTVVSTTQTPASIAIGNLVVNED